MDTTDPLTELRILRLATRVLSKTEQLTNADERLIARQVRNVLRYGTRQPDGEAQPWDIDAETLTPCAQEDSPALDLTPHPRVSYLAGNSIPFTLEDDVPPFPGFMVESRVRQLGYRLFPDHRRTVLPRLTRRLVAEWAARFAGSPAQHRGQDWYAIEDAPWVDHTIQDFLRTLPIAITRVQPGEEDIP